MKERLNLYALKHKKTSRKSKKIYDKAQRFREKRVRTADLSDDEIMEIASRYQGLKVKLLHNAISVKSKYGSWVIVDEKRFLVLYHHSVGLAEGKIREGYHLQDIFEDLEFLFASIESHDGYKLGEGQKRMRDIEKSIEEKKNNLKTA